MIEKDKLINFLYLMYKIRYFEEYAKKLYKENLLEGNFLGALHTYIGEEAIAVGVCSELRKDDVVFSTHRGHGHYIAKGGSIKKLLAEIMGKSTGTSRGYGGSMHLFEPEIGFLGGNGIVGGGLSLSIGAGYTFFYKNKDNVCVCFFGDGAACQGVFHESLNIASLWKLPVIFVCENNCYAVTTPVEKAISVKNIGIRAIGYGIPGKVIDGNDVIQVYETAKEAIERARKGEGPTLIECKTYRIDPHCQVIKDTRKKEEIEKWKEKDPIIILEKKLKECNLINENDIEKFKEEILKELKEAEEFAIKSPFPDVEEFKIYCKREEA